MRTFTKKMLAMPQAGRVRRLRAINCNGILLFIQRQLSYP